MKASTALSIATLLLATPPATSHFDGTHGTVFQAGIKPLAFVVRVPTRSPVIFHPASASHEGEDDVCHANATVVPPPPALDKLSPNHSNSDHNNHNGNPAFHQIDHRAKEKGAIKLGEELAGQIVRSSELSAERLAERASGRLERSMEKYIEKVGQKNLVSKSTERIISKATNQATERAGERFAQLGAERTAERAGDNFLKQWWRSFSASIGHGTERIGERLGERGLERGMDHGLLEAGGRAVKRGSEIAGERMVEAGGRLGERGLERGIDHGLLEAGGRAAKRVSEIAGERMLEAGERLGERGLERGIDHGLLEAGGRAAKRGSEIASERMLEAGGRIGEHGLERGLDHGLLEAGGRAAKRGSEIASERIFEAGGRMGKGGLERGLDHGLLEAGGRAAELGMDRVAERATTEASGRFLERSAERGVAGKLGPAIERLFGVSSEKLALRLGRGLLITLPVLGGIFALYLLKSDIDRLKEDWALRIKTSSAFFLGAGFVDGLDSVLHFFIAFALLKHLSHHRLAVAEELSFACAIASTVCAVVGEIVSLRIQKRRQDDNKSTGDSIGGETDVKSTSPA
jgi:hypothetical protein